MAKHFAAILNMTSRGGCFKIYSLLAANRIKTFSEEKTIANAFSSMFTNVYNSIGTSFMPVFARAVGKQRAGRELYFFKMSPEVAKQETEAHSCPKH